MVEQYLGISLEKGHSAADWSTRPLPADWLNYAALDVELLIELRDVLVGELERHRQAGLGRAGVRRDPRRRPAGAPRATRGGVPRASTICATAGSWPWSASLWQARDRLAAERDVAPGRALPDAAILAAVKANPKSEAELATVAVFTGPRQRRLAGYWYRRWPPAGTSRTPSCHRCPS